MASHSSASVREPHVEQTTRTNTILNALKRRAQAKLNDPSLDPQSKAILRYALETHDPWLAELVRRAEAEEDVFDNLRSAENDADEPSDEKIEALAEVICRAGDEPATKSAALLVLMSSVEHATHPKAVASAAKHLAFSRCGELNFCEMIEAQVATFERELRRE